MSGSMVSSESRKSRYSPWAKADPGVAGHAQALVLLVDHPHQAGVFPGVAVADFRAGVGAAVVHQDDLLFLQGLAPGRNPPPAPRNCSTPYTGMMMETLTSILPSQILEDACRLVTCLRHIGVPSRRTAAGRPPNTGPGRGFPSTAPCRCTACTAAPCSASSPRHSLPDRAPLEHTVTTAAAVRALVEQKQLPGDAQLHPAGKGPGAWGRSSPLRGWGFTPKFSGPTACWHRLHQLQVVARDALRPEGLLQKQKGRQLPGRCGNGR